METPIVGAVRITERQAVVFRELLTDVQRAEQVLNAFIAGIFSTNSVDVYRGVTLTFGPDGSPYLRYEKPPSALAEAEAEADIVSTVTGS